MRRAFSLLFPAVMALMLAACTPAAGPGGHNDRVLFLLGEQFDPQEFWGPYSALCAAGYQVDLAGREKNMELAPDSHLPEANIKTNISLGEVDVSRYFALIVPGGPSAANVARFPKAGEIAREFNAAGKFIGTVCHGARVLMPEGIFKNRPTTCIFMIADELCDQWKAGDYGMYLDLPVVIDRNLICSRDPRDIAAMAEVLINHFAESGGLKVVPRQGQALIVLPGATKHQRWVLDRLGIFGISPIVISEEQINDLKQDDKAVSRSDMLVVLDGIGVEKVGPNSLASIVEPFRMDNKTILLADGVKKSMPGIDPATAKLFHADNLAYAMRQIVESAKPGPPIPRVAVPDDRTFAENYARTAARSLTGAPWNPSTEYDAVLALWNGYDDDAAARMNEFLAGSGRKVLIVGARKGPLTGLNGSNAQVTATYDEPIKLTASAVVVAPGGLWPKRTKAQQAVQPQWVEADEPARRKRLDWLTSQYRAGVMLVAFGFDSLYLGQQKLFRGKRFASTDQASVIWFGSEGAEYSPDWALFSDRNLLTAKPLVGVNAAIRLLQERLKGRQLSCISHTPDLAL
jgi:protease I